MTHYNRVMMSQFGPMISSCIDQVREQGLHPKEFIDGLNQVYGLGDKYKEADHRHFVDLITFMGEFENNGCQTFKLGEHLFHGLSSRTLKEVGEEVKAPYKCFLIDISEANVTWKLNGGASGFHQMDGVYVLEDHEKFHFFCSSVPKGDSLNDATIRFFVRKGEEYESLIKERCKDFEKSESISEKDGVTFYKGEGQEMPYYGLMVGVVNLALNLCLYLSSYKPEVKRHFERNEKRIKDLKYDLIATDPTHPWAAKVERKLAKERGKVNTTIIAPNLEKEIEKTMREREKRGESRLHLVRGHFLRYRVGKGRSQVEWRWRDPFTRGKGEEFLCRKEYKIVDKD